ncbi:MAG: hypothetical protein RLZZ574_1954 [Cyanobacteriota bacterium]|jgi:hypothetical protein
MGTIALDRVFSNTMVKLQHISWATILLILSPVGIDISSASNIPPKDESKAIAMETYQLAQQEGDDEMLDALQKRQEKIDKLDLGKVRKLTKTESKYSLPPTVQAYARILQVIGLTNRHGKAYLEFEQLVQLLKKWEQPYKAIALVRKEYTEDQYSIPAEFKQDIPGWNTYQKYAEYLPDL